MRRKFSHLNSVKDYNFIAIVITLCLLSSCAKHVDTKELRPDKTSTAIGDALSKGDALFKHRENIDQLREAVKTLYLARDPDNRNYEIEWKYAKYCYFLGKAETKEDNAVAVFEKGRDAAKIALRVEPDKPDGHFWYGANLGELARISPITVGIKSVDEIREAMQQVISVDPAYQGASAYDALGEIEMETRSFRGGKAEKAVEYFEKGIKLAPANSNLKLHLAEAYLALKDDVKARKELDDLITMQPDPEFAAEHKAVVEKGKQLIEKNF